MNRLPMIKSSLVATTLAGASNVGLKVTCVVAGLPKGNSHAAST
jgi:hypothetical protein